MNEKMPAVLWEDEEVLFVCKKAGVHAQSPGLPEILSEYLSGETVYPVHRLDREVAGVMVFAKTKKAAAALSETIADGRMEKEYLAWVQGVPPRAGRLVDLLYHDHGKNKTYVVKRKRNGVKEAALTYEVIERRDGGSLLHIRLETGRTHQIRVQFASRGYPLLGDPKYGGPRGPMRLFSHKITLTHPKTGEVLSVAALPDWAEHLGR